MSEYQEKIAKLLRSDQKRIVLLEGLMNKKTGKSGILEKIIEENNNRVKEVNSLLKVGDDSALKILMALLEKTKKTDQILYEFLGMPKFNQKQSSQIFEKIVSELTGEKEGFFIKEEKLKHFLALNPPKNILKALGYSNIQEALEKEDLYGLFAALRFAEDGRWLNEVFFRPFLDLTAADFEKRPIKVMVLDDKWLEVGRAFVAKKLHHVSHLKEAGLVFVVPTEKENSPGHSLEILTLILHYFHEIDFYSKTFQFYAEKNSDSFSKKLTKALKGEVSGLSLSEESGDWRIVQRYLAKNDPNDPRLFEPHVNPEALHWLKAERDLLRLDKKQPDLDFKFWFGLDFVGEFFPAGKKGEELVSYDLIDNVIGLTKGGIMKYLYHQQEALWNKIFSEYYGLEEMERLMVENLDKGVIKL